MCWQRVGFKSLFLGLYARRTHTIMNTHTQIHEEAEASPDPTHTHEHKYHSDQKPVRADRGPACARLGAVPSMPQRPGSSQTWLPGRPGLRALSRSEGFPGWRAPREAGLTHAGSQRRDRQCRREMGRRGPEFESSLVPVLKWPQARPGTDGLFLMLSWRSGEREKEKINTVTVRNLKINQKTYKINSLLLRFRLAPAAKGKQRTTGLG